MTGTIDLEYPFEGRWLVQNSPADRVPSHGTRRFATSYAIDFVPVGSDGRSAPVTLATLVQPEPAGRFPGFGREILAPAAGVVVGVHDAEPDHAARRGIASIGYALTQGRRVRAGWAALAGNYVLVEHGAVVVALCHLQRGSVQVRPGQQVQVGEPVARCGNSGNSTQPHLHLQAMDGHDPLRSAAVPVIFRGVVPRAGDIVAARTP